MKFFDHFVTEMTHSTNARLSIIDPVIASLLINRHVDYAIKYTRLAFENRQKSSFFEMECAGIVMNLLYFLLTNGEILKMTFFCHF